MPNVQNADLFDVLHEIHLSVGHGGRNRMVAEAKKNELNRRCQVDLIDMQTNSDGDYMMILVYQDHLTKFVQLHPLQSKTAEEVSKTLLVIFCIFGSPSILQSDNGREFANRVVKNLTQVWPGLKIVYGKPRHSQVQGSVECANQDIEKMLMSWMADVNCQK
ncbi:KRAB-A domain-containing protein 2-like [Spodoptera litura]|uniref:KRAB-A domain-containing protein 2-like n=1 Tax=Spodoptera litura TaxID=69820 RepID=A0A9J7DT30_SPOLT|nr:KRAB-A domain-containing protein 2-like [Spodoptera litura]